MTMTERATRVRRYGIVGTGARAEMYTTALAKDFPETAELVALCDVNGVRMRHHNRVLAEHGAAPVPTYDPADFTRMLDAERIDRVIVCTVDRFHDDYICAALADGCDVITEKPMTTDEQRCRRILDAQAASGREVTVTFNYRYNPVHERVREVIAAGSIGDIGSVHFEWLLDTRHGADYFRRWHREKANSGGLMVHKASHHFDLVNWWIDDAPEVVFGFGRLFFYGAENGRRRGLARPYERAHGSPAAADDPFALHLKDVSRLTALYLEAEHEDGYLRDRNVFAPGITIEDDMAVLVRYRSGATLTYHLTAYAPWEGYRVMFNGSAGRLELEVVEPAIPSLAAGQSAVLFPGGKATSRLVLRRIDEAPVEVDLPAADGEHGGGDARMLADLFGQSTHDPLARRSSHIDGARALLIGIGANRSFDSGQPVAVEELLPLEESN
jgi:predicted dehydrogenase